MEYKYLTQDERDDIVARDIKSREQEHFLYQHNIDKYTHILNEQLKDVPDEWPDDLVKFKGLGSEQLAAVLKGDDYTLARKLQYKDRVRLLLNTEACQQHICETAHAGSCAQLPDEDRREAAMKRVSEAESRRSK